MGRQTGRQGQVMQVVPSRVVSAFEAGPRLERGSHTLENIVEEIGVARKNVTPFAFRRWCFTWLHKSSTGIRDRAASNIL